MEYLKVSKEEWLSLASTFVREWSRAFYENDIHREALYNLKKLRLLNRKSIIEVRNDARKLLAVAGFFKLEWDSRHFGLEIYKIDPVLNIKGDGIESDIELINKLYSRILEIAAPNSVSLIMRRLRSARVHEIRVLEGCGFRYSDNVVILVANLQELEHKKNIALPKGVLLREINFSDLDAACLLAKNSFKYSRFYIEPLLQGQADDVYQSLVMNSFARLSNNLWGNAIFLHGLFAGFTIYSHGPEEVEASNTKLMKLELFIVDEKFRGMGLGTILLNHSMSHAKNLGMSLMEATTWMANASALSTYQKLGFVVKENLLSYYLNLKDNHD